MSNHQTLPYASPSTRSGGVRFFRTVLVVCAVLGLVANGGMVVLALRSMQRAGEGYEQLVQNSRAFGREVNAATIASLKDPVGLTICNGLMVLAAMLGAGLAVHLLIFVRQIGRWPDELATRMRFYRRWKPYAAGFTGLAFFCARVADDWFWVAATRHHPVGSGPPFVATAVLVFGGMFAWWWMGKGEGRG